MVHFWENEATEDFKEESGDDFQVWMFMFDECSVPEAVQLSDIPEAVVFANLPTALEDV
jgi:hypothetical protein